MCKKQNINFCFSRLFKKETTDTLNMGDCTTWDIKIDSAIAVFTSMILVTQW